MRPVSSKEVHKLLKWRPLLLLNKTLFGPAFVDSIVRRSSAHITSKGGNGLPLELWCSILQFSQSSDSNDYALVRPQIIARGTDGGKELICQKFKRWTSFGTIKTLEGIENCNLLLAHPDKHRVGLHNPFNSPHSREYGRPVSIPVEALDSKVNFLHVRLEVPDVIKYLEGGSWNTCLDERIIGRFGKRYAIANWLLHEHDDLNRHYYIMMLCPVCVGAEHALSELKRRPGTYDFFQGPQISILKKRLRELEFTIPAS
ncbi:hypothetical protein FHETE_7814 [Fusarium heterosporum]|uniref:Uncharacterized protein n=1 Tax=Fusarium heterosporum TaxID=42747 RepID=A0A8H5T495_FUSHE|nr:hypothetical protein FHETE_7814 [Fusarium heterosporum]